MSASVERVELLARWTPALEKAARRAALARAELDEAIRLAAADGVPLRTISAASGYSYEWTRRIAAGTAGAPAR